MPGSNMQNKNIGNGNNIQNSCVQNGDSQNSEFRQQYYIHSAARITNYFSWVKFMVTISSGAIAAAASTLFAVKEAKVSFQVLMSFSLVCFFIAVICGLLSFVGHVKFEESKALSAYRSLDSKNTNCISRITVDPWYSAYGNRAFYTMCCGFMLVSSSVVVYWIEQFFTPHWMLTVFELTGAFLLSFIFMLLLYARTRKYLFTTDYEDVKIAEFEQKSKK